MNCGREDLIFKSIDNLYKSYRVCMNHFKNNMFSNPEKTRLLISAVPTQFGNFNCCFIYSLESRYKVNFYKFFANI